MLVDASSPVAGKFSCLPLAPRSLVSLSILFVFGLDEENWDLIEEEKMEEEKKRKEKKRKGT